MPSEMIPHVAVFAFDTALSEGRGTVVYLCYMRRTSKSVTVLGRNKHLSSGKSLNVAAWIGQQFFCQSNDVF